MRAFLPSVRKLMGIMLVGAIFLVGGAAAFQAPLLAQASGSSTPLLGYAWGASYISGSSGDIGGIGWVSFNCSNDSSCSTSNYSVSEDSSGNLSGYAWSSNYGWIQFGGLSGFPSGAGTTAGNARIASNSLIGWARAVSGGTGSGVTNGSEVWDGWISLSGSGYGISLVGNNLQGYAWGGPDLGWILFNTPYSSGGGTCIGVCVSAPIVNLKVNNSHVISTPVAAGSPVSVTWTTSNVSSCVATGGDSGWRTPAAKAVNSASPYNTLAPSSSVSFTLTCVSSAGNYVFDTVSLPVSGSAVGVSLLVNGATSAVVNSGDNATLSWTSSGATSCSSSANFSTGGATSSPGITVGPITSQTTYWMTCRNASSIAGPVDAIVDVNGSNGGGQLQCINPAGGASLNAGQQIKFAKKLMGGGCDYQWRTCDGTTGELSGSATYNKLTCSPDPLIHEI